MADADVLIIGGGIVGCSTAYFLAKRGANVMLLEKGEISDEQSGRNWGWIRQQGRNPREIPLIMHSIGLWAELAKELGSDIEWLQQGSLRLAYDEEAMAKYEAWTGEAQRLGLDTSMLSAREVKELIPALEGDYLGGAYTPTDGQAEPRKATTAVARAAQEFGAQILTRHAVDKIQLDGGSISEVVTEQGTFRAPVVVCAAGAWSGKLGRMIGLNIPQRSIRATVANTAPAPIITHTVIWGDGVALRQKSDGTFNIAGGGRGDYDVTLDTFRNISWFLPNFLRNRQNMRLHFKGELLGDISRAMPWSSARKHPFAHTIDVEPPPNADTVAATRQNLINIFPSLGDIRIERTWAGRIDATPDAVPIIGEVPGIKGFIIATGFSGHGFAMGPGAGHVISELILDGNTSIDITPFRYSRFRERDMADWTQTI